VLDITPATALLGQIVRGIRPDQLERRTPSECTVGELLDHVQTFARAFAGAAAKADDEMLASAPPRPDASRLGPDWDARIPSLLDDLAAAWREPAAWDGMTTVGGLHMPGEAAGVVAADEVIVHGWDLAVASGQPYEPPAHLLEALMPFLEHVAQPEMEAAREGLFGPVVDVGPEAPLLHRVLGLAGRDPGWAHG
jgi:uncharacterized protein (TIGR03086 family)